MPETHIELMLTEPATGLITCVDGSELDLLIKQEKDAR